MYIFGYTRGGNVPAPKNEGNQMAKKTTVYWVTPLGARRNTFYHGRAVDDPVGLADWWITKSIQEGKAENIKVYKNGRLIVREAIFV